MAKILVMDCETTGMDPAEDRLVEIGAVKVDTAWEPHSAAPINGIKVDGMFKSLINPQMKIPPAAMGVHHITDAMVEHADPNVGRVIVDMEKDIGFDGVEYIAFHNAKFDRQFLENEFNPGINYICTYKVAAYLYPDAPNHKNATIYYYLGIHEYPPFDLEGETLHRALPDAMITASILMVMLQQLSIDRMVEISGKPILQKKIGFGKHFGKLWSEIDDGYINWILGKAADFDEDVVYTARCQKIERAQR